MTISRVQAEALATLACRLQPEWDHPGVLAAIRKADPLGTPAAIAAALCNLADTPNMHTPALLPEPGRHWGGTTVATRKPPVLCVDHPTEPAGRCRPCEQAAITRDEYHAKMQALQEARR